MHIVLYHDALIPPLQYGGTERVIAWLAKALVSLGHRVSLIAREGSAIPGVQVIPLPAHGRQAPDKWQTLIPSDADILHLHGTPTILPRIPFIVTIHGNGQPGETFHPNTVFISRSHATRHGSNHFVYNGIDPDEYSCDEVRDDFVVFLAKASWKVKNLQGAIDVARGAGLRLEVMGSRNWPMGLHRYLPTIRGVHYRGMVGDNEKKSLLRRARALLFPVRWHEPFGLAVTEALASGCPVLGTPYGSLPEIVTAETGFLSTCADTLVRALKERSFSPRQCRARVFEGFTHLDMARNYVKYYELVLREGGRGLLSKESPSFRGQSQEKLLPWTHTNGPGSPDL